MPDEQDVVSNPLIEFLLIREALLLSCQTVLDTNTPDTSSLIEEVVCLDITTPMVDCGC